jgi:hypothetical protein
MLINHSFEAALMAAAQPGVHNKDDGDKSSSCPHCTNNPCGHKHSFLGPHNSYELRYLRSKVPYYLQISKQFHFKFAYDAHRR